MTFACFSAFRTAFSTTKTGIFAEYSALTAIGAFSAVIFPAINWSVLAWFILLPLYFTTERCSARGAFLRGLTWGYAWSFFSIFWLREIAIPVPFILAFILALFPAVWALLTHFLRRNLSLSPADRLKDCEQRNSVLQFRNIPAAFLFIFASTSAWCVLEWTRSWFGTGLPWNYLGTSQWKNLPMIQICEFTGVYGISFLVAFFNIALAVSITQIVHGAKQKKYVRPYFLFAALVLLIANFSLGMHLFKKNAPNPRKIKYEAIGLVQCDISQRRVANHQRAKEALDVCLDLSRKLLIENEAEKNLIRSDFGMNTQLKLIVWPETAVPFPFVGGSSLSEEFRREIGNFITRYKVPFLVGSIDFQPNSNPNPELAYDVYNAALFLNQDGGRIADRYYKIHRVPFGEYVPYGDTFPTFNKMVGMGRNLTPGGRFNPIEVIPGVKAGVSICYESVFQEISRGHVLNGANLLIVMSNDAWYPTSYEPDQHYVNGLFRAVETRLPLLRSGNSNYSVLISPRGELLDSVPSRKQDPGIRVRAAKKILVPVPLEHKLTFYTIYGNIFIAFCGFILLCGLIWAFANWMIFRNAQADSTLYKNISEGSNK